MRDSLTARGNMDRRKYPRYPMDGALEVQASGMGVPVTATIRDISAGGCRLDSRIALTTAQTLRIELPRGGAEPLVVMGTIVRVDAMPAERMYYYGVRFRIETAALRDSLIAHVEHHAQRREAAGDRRSQGGVDVKFAVTVSAPGVAPFSVMAIALSTEGLRVASDRVLRQEWLMALRIKLPGGMIGAPPLVMSARAKTGAKSVRGSYVQDVVFVEPSVRAISEIERAITQAVPKPRGVAS